MNLFVFAELNKQQQTYLQSQLPQDIKPYFYSGNQTQETKEAFNTADLLFGNPPYSWFTNSELNLKFWQLESTGFDQFQQVKVAALVVNMGNFFADACAETMVSGVLAFYRGLPTLFKLQQKKVWQGKEVRTKLELLSQKQAIVLGAGTIGKAVKRMLEGFGTKVKLTARNNPAAQILSKEELFQHLPVTDLVINTLPGSLDKYVSEEFLQKMKKGSVYANVGRGNTTDEAALLNALTSGHLAGAVLDVTEQEPLPENSPLWQLDNVILTQHTGGGQALEIEGKIDRFIQNLHFFLGGKEISDQVNLNQGY
ncbi:D-2-hydroxyacid dehydrogenase [Rufibacter tibetensis]|uniref:Hydroxyacid dehydrogenase n=1 Tax=Rufibacter tibetensis TaxID=512763 RepID=A0A0P0D1B2_9BACT|nr:D-2-hydroxyacid dehydrogenase [Rufibacter tibetensis]ALJ00606.1 hydroxyacid dehydrogenase [Rufibacter tibetensis]